MKKLFINLNGLLIFISFAYSCKSYKKTDNSSLPYSKAEIYCTCIATIPSIPEDSNVENPNVENIVMINCSDQGYRGPNRLIKAELLYYSTIDTNILNSLREVFFYSNHKSEIKKNFQTSGFVILMKKNEFIADTLTFLDQDEFALNEKYKLRYPINIIDSVRKIIGKDRIECE